jgi:bifunctional enzyme CysN/CysC
MSDQSALIAADILAYLQAQESKTLLRFITCGSVDDGKSTLIGRLLWDSKMVFEDQLAVLQADSKRVGTQGDKIDYALLLDGLQAEREQGITIDVAYRFFTTDKRKFIVADTPGHEQYTRNMVTGASTAQVAIILIDARKGVLTQTRRHSYLVSLVGIRQVVLAINKMDLIDYDPERFEAIREEYEAFAAGLGFDQIAAIPLSALEGDNVLAKSANTPWYSGPTLMELLETVQVRDEPSLKPFRMRVQWVNRPDSEFRGFSGTIASGRVRPGDPVLVASSGRLSQVARIVTMDGDRERAEAGEAVTLTLTDEVDISRGEMLADPQQRPCFSDRLEAKVVWMHDEPLLPGNRYLIKAGASTLPGRIEEILFRINVNTLLQEPGAKLDLNEIGVCRIALDRPLAFDSYRENRGTGAFIVIDRLTNATVGAGMMHQPLQLADASAWTHQPFDAAARAQQKGQMARILWIRGTASQPAGPLAELVGHRLHTLGRHAYVLTQQGLAGGLNADLGPGEAHAAEARRRMYEAARMLADAGLIAVVAADDDAEPGAGVLHLDAAEEARHASTLAEQAEQLIARLREELDPTTPDDLGLF